MTAYSYPGLGLDESQIIDLINQEFNLKNNDWVKSKIRETRVKIARQLLMSCLIDHLGYTQNESGAVCLKDHCTARWSKEMITGPLWDDKHYGDKIRHVYFRCVEIKKGWFETKTKKE